jgi:hypothetical protein
MVRSRSIGGDDGSAWRMTFDAKGQVKGEAVFGEWLDFPDTQFHGYYDGPPSRPTHRASDYLISQENWILVQRSKVNLQWQGSIPASNTVHEYN